MFIQFTEKQYKLFVRIMQVMQVFYGNDFSSICKEVGEAYGAKKADIENAYTILTDVKVTDEPFLRAQGVAGIRAL